MVFPGIMGLNLPISQLKMVCRIIIFLLSLEHQMAQYGSGQTEVAYLTMTDRALPI